ncbi:hypothetical protein BDV98DRAFT_200834 [Pterulicium gracile]|uniref:Uncharacterized protein n=1 Tax=Pterulicium gracile TaxID=1884261 RepID=A0A5C3QAT9_9AGAR|nr:hypothetical protein BDV98DRAFT_200834 [Pterula gracilis]
MCSVSHCRVLLPAESGFMRCEQHRKQNRYHSKLKRSREKAVKAQGIPGGPYPEGDNASEAEDTSDLESPSASVEPQENASTYPNASVADLWLTNDAYPPSALATAIPQAGSRGRNDGTLPNLLSMPSRSTVSPTNPSVPSIAVALSPTHPSKSESTRVSGPPPLLPPLLPHPVTTSTQNEPQLLTGLSEVPQSPIGPITIATTPGNHIIIPTSLLPKRPSVAQFNGVTNEGTSPAADTLSPFPPRSTSRSPWAASLDSAAEPVATPTTATTDPPDSLGGPGTSSPTPETTNSDLPPARRSKTPSTPASSGKPGTPSAIRKKAAPSRAKSTFIPYHPNEKRPLRERDKVMEYEESEDPHQLREQREEGGFVTVYSPATAVQSTVTESSIPAVPPKPLLPVSVETPMVESKLDEGNASIIILENPAPPPQGFLSTTGVPAAGSSGGRSFVPYDPNAKPKKQNRRKKAGTSKENSASSLATDATSATESLKSEVPEKQDDQHSPTVATEQTASAPNAEEVVSAVPDSETSGTHEQTPMPSIPATTAADASRFWATLYPPSHLVHPSSGQPTVGSAANSNAAARTSTYLVGTGHVPTVYPPNSPYAPMSWQGVMRGPDQPVYGTPYYPTYAQYYPPWPPISAGTANPPPAKKRKKGGAGKKASRAASVASVSTEEQTASASKEASATGKGKNREASDSVPSNKQVLTACTFPHPQTEVALHTATHRPPPIHISSWRQGSHLHKSNTLSSSLILGRLRRLLRERRSIHGSSSSSGWRCQGFQKRGGRLWRWR